MTNAGFRAIGSMLQWRWRRAWRKRRTRCFAWMCLCWVKCRTLTNFAPFTTIRKMSDSRKFGTQFLLEWTKRLFLFLQICGDDSNRTKHTRWFATQRTWPKVQQGVLTENWNSTHQCTFPTSCGRVCGQSGDLCCVVRSIPVLFRFIHRDIKPANIAPGYRRRNVVFLFDFGLARFIYEDEQKTRLRRRRSKVCNKATSVNRINRSVLGFFSRDLPILFQKCA